MSGRLRTHDRQALELWLLSRAGVFLVAAAAAMALDSGRSAVGVWARWDADLLRKIAEYGYDGRPEHYADRGVEAFFPGLPLLLRAVHAVVPDWTLAGLVVSLVAGAVGAAALARLGGPRAVLYLVAAPTAVFLAAGYTEALFLALAVPAWLAARDGRWAAAGLLAGGASAVRVNGVFLTAGLAVLYLTSSRGRLRRDALWLAVPAGVVVAWFGYLRWLTGDWLRWFAAQEEGWNRRLTPPWDALETTLRMADGTGAYAYVAVLELAAVATGVVGTAVLLRQRAWAEASYVGLSVAALATSTFYFSVARSALLWFPLWVLLARAGERWRWVHAGVLALGGPLMVLGVVLFTTGRWAG